MTLCIDFDRRWGRVVEPELAVSGNACGRLSSLGVIRATRLNSVRRCTYAFEANLMIYLPEYRSSAVGSRCQLIYDITFLAK